ncbi:hypothetical protein [Staphylococcus canis]|uniref:ABC transporter permease n=1 Tax=Staphylococcus canis TaxID=2724942 RepID=A0ABS0T6N0_9STAP|nr:hypothetical protein [Staphylococcus canis]MBI5974394.1 hypothetical protein [Staphylococcus canis]
MLKLEMLSWIRSKKYLIILFIFIFSGFSSPLIAYYSNDIISSFSGNESTKIIAMDPKWQDLISSYFKNASQLVMFICAYIIADKCRMGKDKSIQLYYKTRAKNSSKIFIPKYFTSIFILAISGIIGGACVLYVTWVFFDSDIDFKKVIVALIVQLIGVLIFSTISATISFWINSAFISALIVEATILLAIFFDSIEKFKDWSPTSLLKPNDILFNKINYELLLQHVGLGILISLVCIVTVYFKPLKVKTKRKE